VCAHLFLKSCTQVATQLMLRRPFGMQRTRTSCQLQFLAVGGNTRAPLCTHAAAAPLPRCCCGDETRYPVALWARYVCVVCACVANQDTCWPLLIAQHQAARSIDTAATQPLLVLLLLPQSHQDSRAASSPPATARYVAGS